jgi:hypothetical protein
MPSGLPHYGEISPGAVFALVMKVITVEYAELVA